MTPKNVLKVQKLKAKGYAEGGRIQCVGEEDCPVHPSFQGQAAY